MRVVFMGTPEFAVPSLQMLINEGYDIIGVITQPDRPKGRGKKLAPPPVKELALAKGLPVYQFERIKRKEGVDQLKDLQPDLMVTAAFGQILSKEILDIPPQGCINVHGSLLPKYRGPAPIQWAILQGEKETGITTMYTDVGLDTGDMILKKAIPIYPNETGGELYCRLAKLGAEVLKDTLRLIKEGNAPRTPQNPAEASYYPMLNKKIGDIDWSQTAFEIKNLVRAIDPWPGAYTWRNGEAIKIWRVNPYTKIPVAKHKPGEVLISDEKTGLVVVCGDGALLIEEIQASGGKRMSSAEYLRGKKINTGEIFIKDGG